jgi:hypothetical protein
MSQAKQLPPATAAAAFVWPTEHTQHATSHTVGQLSCGEYRPLRLMYKLLCQNMLTEVCLLGIHASVVICYRLR